MTDSLQSTIIVSPVSGAVPRTVIQKKSEYLFTMISPKVTRKLTAIAVLNIVLNIVLIVLNIGHHAYGTTSVTTNGQYTFLVSILILILCREQIYVLTSVFILVFFQLLFLLEPLVTYVHLFLTSYYMCKYSSRGECRQPANLILTSIGLIITLMMSCANVYNLMVIQKGRRRPAVPTTADYYSRQVTPAEAV